MNMKKKTKKILSLALAAAITLSMTACGGKVETSSKEVSVSGIATNDTGEIREDLTALELTRLMGNGINLGNTMEAYGHLSLGTSSEVSDYETLWGQPVTTQEMITGMKNAGFDTLRIPVAWTNMMNYEDGDYTINEAYLNRVEEIINYARNEDMYVIVNDHWDGGWWGMFGSEDTATQEKAMEMYKSMWTQIAERYKNYSDYLIFESANEELGNRLNDTDIATDSGALSEDECYEKLLEINQAFVDTVRSTGGNNEQRFLLIAGYNTDISCTVDDRYEMPTDTAQSKLLISVHYYDPSGYCINESLESWGTKDDYDDMNESLAKMTKFTDAGYGVIIGEYGALPKEGGGLKENTYEYTENILNNCDLYNFVPVLWDTNGLYDKEFLAVASAKLSELFKSRNYESEKDLTDEEVAANAQSAMDEAYENASEGFSLSDDEAVAWIMYTSLDWNVQYSVGDVYDPTTCTAGIVAQDAEITGEGTYTVSLDFTGTSGGYADSTQFSAVGIANGETLFPDYVIQIDEIKINGEVYEPIATPYTTTDDSKCTRVNLYNEWVTEVPEGIRTADGNTDGASPVIIDNSTLGNVETIEVTFTYGPAAE
jgi:endoglucanase